MRMPQGEDVRHLPFNLCYHVDQRVDGEGCARRVAAQRGRVTG